jgi:hypothetical protein
MTILPEVSARLKTKAALLSESSNLMLSLLGQIEEATRRIDSNITGLLAEDVRTVNSAVRSFQVAVNPARAVEQLRSCVTAAREVVTAARTAGYADQRVPGVHERA